MLEKESIGVLREALERLDCEFQGLPPVGATAASVSRMSSVLEEVAARLADNFPYFHPLYAGQMLKPPHPVARAAYALATWINPNNHALDGGRASTAMEREAVAQIAGMFGWETHLGHLTSGGTMANLEALWVAGRLAPAKKIAASAQSHYTHQRISGVLQLPFEEVPTDTRGRMDPNALERMLAAGDIGCVVATMGTTATGSVDPLPEILELRRRYAFRLHIDAAYGGYFTLAGNLAQETRAAYDRIAEADSIVIDPHKHGLQPYGCGCVLFRDPAVGTLYKHDSPVTYFSSRELHLGEISLECSRPGASAVALWATMRLLPLTRGGEFAQDLEASRRAALDFYSRLAADQRVLTAFPPQLDIVVWAPKSRPAERVFENAARRNLHLAMARLPGAFFGLRDEVHALRSVLMKPEHEQWVDRIWEVLDSSL
ncbi:MAG TPA: aminotransferase class I/II-fold pyridoxal phosphate-dependent enzyme [Bryobacteraceae bacterium]|nr:aminotransferase class I/II-fold pyridoxal phosphate-dependent enzyme [Bryobacteraceae bacterium]